MENSLIQDNFDELMTLTKEDRDIVITYFNNWTESEPAYYEDGKTIQDKLENYFKQWLEKEHLNLTQDDVYDIVDWAYDSLQEWSANTEDFN